MKTRNLLMISAMAAAFTFAAEEAAPEQAAPNAVETCQAAIDNAAKDIPANATAAKYSLAGAKSTLADLDAAYKDDPESDQVKSLSSKCDTQVKIAATQAETQKVRNSTAEKWEKRAATARSIEAIQEQINQARSGKVNDLEAEKAKMKDQEARL